ncbi:MAG: FKBP-type peptidyl-prolyl cis-trans isomerase [Opitutaceae bacterium]
MSIIRPAFPALIAGAVLVTLVTAGQCTRLAMHRAEAADSDPSMENSMPSGLAEAARIAARFPDSQTIANSNLHYIVLRPGEGEPPKTGSFLTVHYSGTLWDGTPFDSSVERGQPLKFRLGVGQVIKGWDLGFASMLPGEKRLLIIPYSLAYGDRGRRPTIPPRATLLFEVELIAIE